MQGGITKKRKASRVTMPQGGGQVAQEAFEHRQTFFSSQSFLSQEEFDAEQHTEPTEGIVGSAGESTVDRPVKKTRTNEANDVILLSADRSSTSPVILPSTPMTSTLNHVVPDRPEHKTTDMSNLTQTCVV